MLSFIHVDRKKLLFHCWLWITAAIFITAFLPAEAVSATGEDEAYVLKLNGSDAYVKVEDDEALRITGDLTLEALVYWDGTPGYQVIASKPNTANETGWAFGIRNGRPEFNAIRAFTDQEDIDFWEELTREYDIKAPSSFSLEPHTWNHLAIVAANSLPGYFGEFRIYHNGTSIVALGASNGEFLQSENTPFLIGRKFDSDSGSGFSGYIDFVRIWDEAVSINTMRDWYSETNVTHHPNRSNLVAYWDFKDGGGSFVSDISGNGHAGQLMNGAEWANKEDVFRIGALETALTNAQQSLVDYPEGVNIGEAPKSARLALQSAIDTAQDIFDNYEGRSQETIDQAATTLRDAITVFLAKVVTPDNVVQFAGGSGSEEDPYLIQTPEQLHQIRGDLAAHYRMLNDIDLAGWSWDPIGTEARPFTGGLDGNGKMISHLTVSLPDNNNIGLFGVITTHGAEAYIRNLGLENVDIVGQTSVGALAGYVINQENGSVRISNSYVSGGTVEADVFAAGGLIGMYGNHFHYELYTHDVYVKDVLVTASSSAGGLLGNYGGGHLSRAYVIGTVKPTNDPNLGRSASPLYAGYSILKDQFKMDQLYWNVTCDGCSLSHNLFGEELILEQFSERESFGDLWDFGSTWLLFDDSDMLPVLQVFHPLTELDISVERSSVQETGYFFPDEIAEIQVTATYDGFAPFELTGTDAVTYVFNDVVDVSSEGMVTALRPGKAEIEIHVGTAVEVIALTVHQVPPAAPHELKVPTTAVQGGTEVLLTWQEPENWGIGEERKYVVAFFDGTSWGSEVELTQPEFAITLPPELNTEAAKFRVRTETNRGRSEDVVSDTFTIDSVAPTIDFAVNGSVGWTDVTAATIVELYDNLSGIDEDRLRYLWSEDPSQPGVEADWKSFRPEQTLTVDSDGKWYLHIVAEDYAGHIAFARSEVFLVDRTRPSAPAIDVVEHDVTQWITTTPVIVNIISGDDGTGSGVKDTLYRTRLGSGVWSEWTSVEDQVVLVEANGITHLEAKTIDVAGNESFETMMTLRIDHEIPKSPAINLSMNGWVDTSVTVWIDISERPVSGHQALEWTTDPTIEPWTTTHDETFSMLIDTEGETTIYARAVNGVGVKSDVSTAIVQIDRGSPVITPNIITLGDGEQYVSNSWTNQDVQISAVFENEFSDLVFHEVRINMQGYYHLDPIVLTEEGKHTVQFMAINEVFGMTEAGPLDILIDKSMPGSPLIITETSDWTNEPVMVTIEHGSITGMSGLKGTEYKIGHDGSWTMYDGPFTVTENGEHYIYARTWNEAGSSTAEEDWAVAVVRMASERPAITLETVMADERIYEPNTWTNQAVTVTADVYSDTAVSLNVQYKIDGKDNWVDYIEAVTVEANGIHTVLFQVEDAAGNVETETLIVKIDDEEPSVSLQPNGNTSSELEALVVVEVDDTLSGVGMESLHYIWSSDRAPMAFDSSWQAFVNGDTLKLSGRDGDWYLHIYAEDVAGNEVIFISELFQLHTPTPPVEDDDDEEEVPTPGDGSVGDDPDGNDEGEGPAPGDGNVGDDPDSNDGDEGPAPDNGNVEDDASGSEEAGTESEDGDDEEPKPVKSFTDIAGHWAASTIRQAAKLEVVSGYPNGTFKPDHPIARAEFTLMLVNLLQPEGTDITLLTFTDEDKIGSWARQAIAFAVRAGIVTGYHDGSFRPDAYITREEMALMIAKAIEVEIEENVQTAFRDDNNISHWAKGAVEAIRQLGITIGRNDNRFAPKETATRAEAVTMLLRLLEE